MFRGGSGCRDASGGRNRLYLVGPRCKSGRHPLDERPGVTGFVSPQAQRVLCLAGASWSIDKARANLKEFCGLSVGDTTIRSTWDTHGVMRDRQRDEPQAREPFPKADGHAEFQTDGTCVNATCGWREVAHGTHTGNVPPDPTLRYYTPFTGRERFSAAVRATS